MSEQKSSNFAVIRLNSKQFIVKKGSRIKADRVSEDSVLEVLLANVDGNLLIGEPVTENFGVKIEVLEDRKDSKLEVRRYKSKSKYRKHKGHRQPISILHVAELGGSTKSELVWKKEEAISEDKPSKKAESEEKAKKTSKK